MASSTYVAIVALIMGALSAGCGDGGTGGSSSGGMGGAGGSGSTLASSANTTSSNGSSGGSSGSTSTSTSGSSSSQSSVASSGSGGMNTPCAGPLCDVTVIGTGFDEHNGQTLHLGFVPQGGKNFDFESSAVVANGTFTIMGPQALTKGAAYFMNYYADVNSNMMCDQTPTDHVWRTSIPPVMQNLVLTAPHSQSQSNIGCGGF